MVVQVAVNYAAILAASIASFILGMLWYGLFFRKPWIQLMGFDKKKLKEAKNNSMAKMHIITFLSGVVLNFVLAHIIGFAQVGTIIEALGVGFLVWIGFVATLMLGTVLWEGKPIKLYVINVLYYLFSFLIASAILFLI